MNSRDPQPGSAPGRETLPVNTRYALLLSTLGTGMVLLDQSAINIALPAIRAGLDLEVRGLQWIMSLYILFLSAPLLVCGVLGDRFGRVRFYITGASVFGLAGLLCGLAGNLEVLLLARAAQGFGAAMMVAVGLALLNANTPREIRGRVIGIWAGLTSLVIAVGPVAGGLLVDAFSWRLVFFINAPLALLGVLVGWRKLPESRADEARTQTDILGVVLMLLGMGALLFALIEGPRFGWKLSTLVSLAAGLLLLTLFVLRQRTALQPLVPPELFRHRVFVGINLVTMLQWLTISTLFFFLPINLQQMQGYSATESGLAVLPVSLAIVVLSRISGKLSDRIGPMWLILAGIVLIGAALALFSGVTVVEDYISDLLPAILCFGAGMGLLVAPLTHVAMNALPDRYSGLASGVNNTAARMSNMLAVAVFGSLMVLWFESGLGAALENLMLDESLTGVILAQAGSLGVVEIPRSVPDSTSADIAAAVTASFHEAWRVTMLACVALCGVSALAAFRLLRGFQTRA
jgi:EmrB/QacA subfamily drug resistance transporter